MTTTTAEEPTTMTRVLTPEALTAASEDGE